MSEAVSNSFLICSGVPPAPSVQTRSVWSSVKERQLHVDQLMTLKPITLVGYKTYDAAQVSPLS